LEVGLSKSLDLRLTVEASSSNELISDHNAGAEGHADVVVTTTDTGECRGRRGVVTGHRT
jgi:hypothetical protein